MKTNPKALWAGSLLLATSLAACGQTVPFSGFPVAPAPARPSSGDDTAVLPSPLPPEEENNVTEDTLNPIDTDEPIPAPRPTAVDGFFLDYDFESSHRVLKADVVWTVDNSSSMADEAENVRRNFDSFANRLESVIDVKIGLISTSVTDTTNKIFGVKMSDSMKAKGHFQYDVPVNLNTFPSQRGVGSWNLLAFAAMTSCSGLSIDLSDPWRTIICGRLSSNPNNNRIEDLQTILDAGGKLSNFYRSEAKRIYVFVTDDETRHFKGVDFKAVLDAQAANNYHVFAFAGDAKDPQCQKPGGGGQIFDKEGVDYMNLAAQTNGKTFSVCQPDWGTSFDTLLDSIYELVEEGYAVPGEEQVAEVLLDNKVLATSQYVVSGNNKVYLKQGVLKHAGQKIKIRTQKKQSQQTKAHKD